MGSESMLARTVPTGWHYRVWSLSFPQGVYQDNHHSIQLDLVDMRELVPRPLGRPCVCTCADLRSEWSESDVRAGIKLSKMTETVRPVVDVRKHFG